MTSANGEDAMLTKIDSSGNIVWTDLLGGSGDDQVNSVQEVIELVRKT